jgi:hypothetical protein
MATVEVNGYHVTSIEKIALLFDPSDNTFLADCIPCP